MKQPNYLIRIPEPCHEDWNTMQPDSTGRYCSSCSKSVIDFSGKTDTEIRDILMQHKSQKVCGHFKSSQVNRPLNLRIDLKALPSNMSLTRRFTVAVLVVFGSLLFSCTDHLGNKIGEIEVEDREYIMGAIPAPYAEPDTVIPTPPVVKALCEEELLKGDTIIIEDTLEAPVYPVFEHPTDVTMGAVWYEPEEVIDSVLQIMTEDIHAESPIDSLDPGMSKETETISQNALPLFRVYPNPSASVFNISYENTGRSDISLHIFDMQGSLVKPVASIKEQYEGKYVIPVDLNGLPDGIYLVNMIKDGKRSSEQLILSR